MFATAGWWGAARIAPWGLLALGLAGAAFGDVSGEVSAEVQWRRAWPQGPGGAIHALALDGARLAVGDERGVRVGESDAADASGASLVRVLRRGPVRDLARLPDGALLAATDRGLYRLEADGRTQLLGLGAGATQSPILRVAVAPGLAAVATEDGVRVSPDTRVWRRLAGGLPRAPATAVALRARGDGFEVWSAQRGLLWRTRTGVGPSPSDSARRETLPFAESDGGAEHIALDFAGHDLVVVLPSALALRQKPDEPWRILRPTLPPGARARRIAFALGRYWLATDRGLLEAERLEGLWRRAAAPAGTGPIGDLAGAGDRLVAASRDALLVASVADPREPPAGARSATAQPSGDPLIHRVHRAALRYLELRPGRIAALRRGVGRRGWLPEVDLRLTHDTDRTRRRDWDQSFVSGDTRHLYDEESNRSRDLGVELSLSWDLPRLAYDPEEIDVSRESREVIELRDDVLDEITQLYFERRRVLVELAAQSDPAGATARSLRLRAAELAAGIDAWTGGWFTRHAAASPLSGPVTGEVSGPEYPELEIP